MEKSYNPKSSDKSNGSNNYSQEIDNSPLILINEQVIIDNESITDGLSSSYDSPVIIDNESITDELSSSYDSPVIIDNKSIPGGLYSSSDSSDSDEQ